MAIPIIPILKAIGKAAIAIGKGAIKFGKWAAPKVVKATKAVAAFAKAHPKAFTAVVSIASYEIAEKKLIEEFKIQTNEVKAYMDAVKEIKGLSDEDLNNLRLDLTSDVEQKKQDMSRAIENHGPWWFDESIKISISNESDGPLIEKTDVANAVNVVYGVNIPIEFDPVAVKSLYSTIDSYYARLYTGNLPTEENKKEIVEDIKAILKLTAEGYALLKIMHRSMNSAHVKVYDDEHLAKMLVPYYSFSNGTSWGDYGAGALPSKDGAFSAGNTSRLSLTIYSDKERTIEMPGNPSNASYLANYKISNKDWSSMIASLKEAGYASKEMIAYLDYLFSGVFYDTESKNAISFTPDTIGHEYLEAEIIDGLYAKLDLQQGFNAIIEAINTRKSKFAVTKPLMNLLGFSLSNNYKECGNRANRSHDTRSSNNLFENPSRDPLQKTLKVFNVTDDLKDALLNAYVWQSAVKDLQGWTSTIFRLPLGDMAQGVDEAMWSEMMEEIKQDPVGADKENIALFSMQSIRNKTIYSYSRDRRDVMPCKVEVLPKTTDYKAGEIASKLKFSSYAPLHLLVYQKYDNVPKPALIQTGGVVPFIELDRNGKTYLQATNSQGDYSDAEVTEHSSLDISLYESTIDNYRANFQLNQDIVGLPWTGSPSANTYYRALVANDSTGAFTVWNYGTFVGMNPTNQNIITYLLPSGTDRVDFMKAQYTHLWLGVSEYCELINKIEAITTYYEVNS